MARFYGDPNFEAKLGNCLSMYRARRLADIRPSIWRDEFGVEWDRSVDTDIGVVVNKLITPDTLSEFQMPIQATRRSTQISRTAETSSATRWRSRNSATISSNAPGRWREWKPS